MIVACDDCGKEFNRKPSEMGKFNNFCSKACCVSANKRDKTLNGNYSGGKYVPCSECGILIYRIPWYLKQRENHFCSKGCLGLWRSKNLTGEKASNYKNRTKHIKCLFCGKSFKTRNNNRKYCSIRCRGRNQTKIGKTELKCLNCGKVYSVSKSQIKHQKSRGAEVKFCSKKCQTKYCVGNKSPNWIKDRSKIKDNNKTIRWSKKMCEWRERVYKRDNYTCLLCRARSQAGKPVIINAHHIKSFSNHKDKRFCLNNGATLCERCHKNTYNKEHLYEKHLLNNIDKRNSPRWTKEER